MDRSEIIRSLLEAKLKILSNLDEEILGLCDVKDIKQEAEAVARILNAKRKLEKALKWGISKATNENNGQVSSQSIQNIRNSNATDSMVVDGGNQLSNTSQPEVITAISQPTAITTTTTTTVKLKLPKLYNSYK